MLENQPSSTSKSARPSTPGKSLAKPKAHFWIAAEKKSRCLMFYRAVNSLEDAMAETLHDLRVSFQ